MRFNPAGLGFRSLVGLGLVLGASLSMATAADIAQATTTRTSGSASAVHLTGAGSTFDAPFFAAAFARYHQLHPNVSVSYAAVGSGLGIQRLSSETVDFGASDVPMTASEQSSARGGTVLQIPIDLGAVVVSYHVQLGPTYYALRLSGPVLARIFLGQIKAWNDPAIAALNPSIQLPNEAITVVHRSDSSGTTYIFTNYLASVSPAWANGPGTSKTISWPTGVGAKGSSGVAALLKRIPGSIGYFELSYAESKALPYALIENESGAFVPPFPTNVTADASKNTTVSAADFSIVNEPGAKSYPISGYSWLLVYSRQTSKTHGSALAALATWMTHAGQSVAAEKFYVPLPATIQTLASQTIAELAST